MNVVMFRCFVIATFLLSLTFSSIHGTEVIEANRSKLENVYQKSLRDILLRVLNQRALVKQQHANIGRDESSTETYGVINEFLVPNDDEDDETLEIRVDDIFLEPLIGQDCVQLKAVQLKVTYFTQKTNVSSSTKAVLSLGEHTSVSIKKKGSEVTSEWGEYSCCRRPLNIQTRERMANNRYLQLQSRECSWDYCKSCTDDIASSCDILKRTQDACNPNSHYKGFMSRHCPLTCKWCEKDSTTTAATTTARSAEITRTSTLFTTTKSTTTRKPKPTKPARDENVKTVSIYTNGDPGMRLYMFRLQSQANPGYPWKANTEELATFDVYERPTGVYRRPIYFCKANHKRSEKWTIRKRGCSNGWILDFKVYVSNQNASGSEKMYIANYGKGPWTSRVSYSRPCCGYTSAIWPIYVPTGPTINDESKSPYIPTAATRPPVRPSFPTTKPVDAQLSLEPFEQECLDYHNFYRAIHNVAPLEWDNTLAETTKRWANYLVEHAPSHPFKIKSGTKRTKHWPHSDKGTEFRGNGVGENIAWDFSVSGSPAQESVLRWYAEIAYFDPENPYIGLGNKPVGHYTQLLWKESTSLGCARVYKSLERQGRTYKTSYTVAHYAPGGNIRYSRREATVMAYNFNVPPPKADTCMSVSCSAKLPFNKCMGFKNDMRCSCDNNDSGEYGSRPVCQGRDGGCMVNCEKPKNPPIPGYFLWESSCQGQTKCECIYSPVNSRAGATCS